MTIQADKVVIEEQIIDQYGVKGPIERTFHSGIDPLDDVQIAVASKKRFMEWWKLHTTSYPVRNIKGVVDSGRVVRINNGYIDVIGPTFHVTDLSIEEFPFKMGHCDSFVLETSELHTLKNTPRTAMVSASYGTRLNPMVYMDTFVGGVENAKLLSIHTKSTFLNLETSLKSDVEDLTVNAPSLATFEGLNVNVTNLNLVLLKQSSFKGIHRIINNSIVNVCRISIGVDQTYSGGVLSFAMMVPSIEIIPDVSGNPPQGFTDSMEVVAEGRKAGLNIHDIQELLIDKGLGKYARL